MIIDKRNNFKYKFPEHVQATIQNIEREVELEAIFLGPEEIKNEFKDLVPNPGTSRGGLTLYKILLDLQWSQKFILGKTLVEKDEQHGEILLWRDQILQILHKVMDNQADIPKKLGMKLEPHEHLFD